MRPAAVKKALNVIETQFAEYLYGTAWDAVAIARAQVDSSFAQYEDRRRRDPPEDVSWGFQIHRDTPLAFRPETIDGHELRFDVYGRYFWRIPTEPCVEQLTVIRVWAMDPTMIFREDWDAERLKSAVDGSLGRVMARLHFDLADPLQSAPKYHLQFGGLPGGDEHAWWHRDLSVPRVLALPVDIVLATELVVSTAFGLTEPVFQDGSVVGCLMESQREFILPYVEQVSGLIARDRRVLEGLWNNPTNA